MGEATNHIWQSTLFAAAAGVLILAFRKNRAGVRYWLWFSASLKFLVPFALLVSLGGHVTWAPTATRMATEVTAPAVPLMIVQLSRPFPDTARPAPVPERRDWAGEATFGIWALGFAGIALIRWRGWLRVRAALRASVLLDIRAGVGVRSSPGLLEPGVVGWLHPVLLLPAGIAERLTPAQLQAVLAHELCHVRRRDNLWASIHMVVEALFWFHPAVWWIGARLLEERERACDEEVLSMGGEPRVYAEGLLNVCKAYAESPLACVSGVTGSDLKRRIEVIMTNRIALRLNFARKAALAVAGVLTLTVPILVGIVNTPHVRAQSAAAGTPAFETVSIQPGCATSEVEAPRKSGDGPRRGGNVVGSSAGLPAVPPPGSEPGILSVKCAPAANIINAAYGRFADGRPLEAGSLLQYVYAVPMTGGPAWLYTDPYHITAKAPGVGQEMMRGPMMQVLLEDRFQLKVRREARGVPAYALTVAPGGSKLRPYVGDGGVPRREANFSPHFAPDTTVKDMDGVALWLYTITDRPVINRTGLSGQFLVDFVFAPDSTTPGALARLATVARRNGESVAAATAASNPAGPSIFTALEQQLGLRLEPITTQRDFLIVDHAEKPRGN